MLGHRPTQATIGAVNVSLDLPNTNIFDRIGFPNLELPLLLSIQISKNGPGPATLPLLPSSAARSLEPAAKIPFYQTPARLSSPSINFFSPLRDTRSGRHSCRPETFSRRKGNYSLYPKSLPASRDLSRFFFARGFFAPTVAASASYIHAPWPGSRFSNIRGPSD